MDMSSAQFVCWQAMTRGEEDVRGARLSSEDVHGYSSVNRFHFINPAAASDVDKSLSRRPPDEGRGLTTQWTP